MFTRLLFAIAVAVPIIGCGGKREPETNVATTSEKFSSRGKITSIRGDKLEIHHEDMPSIRTFDGKLAPMPSMTMPFAAPPTGVSGIVAGDVVGFEFTVHYDSDPTLRLTKIEKLPATTALTLK